MAVDVGKSMPERPLRLTNIFHGKPLRITITAIQVWKIIHTGSLDQVTTVEMNAKFTEAFASAKVHCNIEEFHSTDNTEWPANHGRHKTIDTPV